MEIEGKIIAVMQLRSGVSQSTGNAWQSQSYVLETEDQYPKKVVFEVFGDKVQNFAIKANQRLKVYFDIDAHEYKGNWYNSVRAWKVEQLGATPSKSEKLPEAPVSQPVDFGNPGKIEELPF